MQTSILNRFPCNFAGTIGRYYGNCPVKFGEDWLSTSKVINDISVIFSCKFGEVWLSTSKVINKISRKFDWVFL